MKSEMISKLKELIRTESVKQVSENYNELLPKLIRVEVDNISDDASVAVGAMYFMINNRVLFIPIIYRSGAVDSISFIGDVETEMIYGLTQKMYKRLMSSGKDMNFGKPMSKPEMERAIIDKGIIGRLFATPQTFSPKVASDNHFDAVEFIKEAAQYDKKAVFRAHEKLLENPEKMEFLKLAFGEEFVQEIEKVASDVARVDKIRSLDTNKTITKIAELNSIPEHKRRDAAASIAKYGFYKLAEDKSDKKGFIREVPKFGDVLVNVKGSMEILKEPGIYNALTRDFSLVPVVVAREPFSNNNYIYYSGSKKLVKSTDYVKRFTKETTRGHLGRKTEDFIGLEAQAIGEDPRGHISAVMGETEPTKAQYAFLLGNKDDITAVSIDSVTRVGDKLVISSNGFGMDYDNSVEIIVGEKYGYTQSGDKIYIHPNHILFVGKQENGPYRSHSGNGQDTFSSLMTVDGMHSPIVKTASIDMRYSAGRFHHNDGVYQKHEIIEKLANDGYDLEEIKNFVKMAEKSRGSEVTLESISKELKKVVQEIQEQKMTISQMAQMIQGAQQGDIGADNQNETVQQIAELAQSVGADPQAVIEAGRKQGMSDDEILTQLQQEVQQVQQQQGAQPQQDGGQPQPQQVDENGDQAPSQLQQQNVDDTQGQPMQGGDGAATGQGQNTDVQNLQAEGYNVNMNPEMINQLKEIADKDVLNATIISYLFDADDAKGVIQSNIEDIRRGVNGLGHTLLMVDIQRETLENKIGQKQLSVFLNRGKLLLNRLTDFLIDVSLID